MSEPRRITSEDLALFAMQLLPAEEMAEIAAYVERSEDARRELAEIQGDLAMYAHTVEMQSPSAEARDRLMKQVGREKKATPIDRPVEPAAVASASASVAANDEFGSAAGSLYSTEEPPKPGVAGRVLPWVGWAVAAGLAVAAGSLYKERETLRSAVTDQSSRIDHLTADAAAARQVLDAMTDSSALRVTLNVKGAPPAVPQGRATYVASKGTLIFLATNLEPLQPSKTYELWLIPAGAGQNPIPAGTFRPDARGNASVIMPTLPKGVEAKAFGVTVEDEGGATTPTLPIVLVGAAAGE
ncbi:anti-sigma factor [Tunturibacter empetritectus]|uniref:Anti-sigma-K factor RskA n=1 Tax=Tunturiibacter lichenicola TaxID=2051959 RepID=A0A7W8J9S5_9BACT|nr:anti-sigma factor [Edaphobacter lichenicola]MBB5344121.1 anti-sigma-K factor RskA [Edaphobacter lichenicola]